MSPSADKQHVIELRSDTFTKPSKQMYEAIANAEVGDSQYDEDVTVIKLEKTCAMMFGKEDGLFMPSGTMANLVAVMVHCYERGSEAIVGDQSHFNLWEQGGIGQIGSVYTKQIENLEDGSFDLEKLDKMMPQPDRASTITRVVCIENTHNWCGGRILPIEFVERLHKLCQKRGVKIHLDGSRVMNASIATGIDLKTLTRHADSVNFCFSKAVGAPIGSILLGSKEFIQKALRVRQSLGGGMRQAGVLAAACLYGLTQVEENIRKDHANAKKLAEGISKVNYNVVSVNVEATETNLVLVRTNFEALQSPELIRRLQEVTDDERDELKQAISVKASQIDSRTIRLVTHLDVSSAEIDLALIKFEYVCRKIHESLAR